MTLPRSRPSYYSPLFRLIPTHSHPILIRSCSLSTGADLPTVRRMVGSPDVRGCSSRAATNHGYKNNNKTVVPHSFPAIQEHPLCILRAQLVVRHDRREIVKELDLSVPRRLGNPVAGRRHHVPPGGRGFGRSSEAAKCPLTDPCVQGPCCVRLQLRSWQYA